MTLDDNMPLNEEPVIYPLLITVHSATETATAGTLSMDVTMQVSADGVEERTSYAYNETDPYGLSPQIRQWLADNPDFPIAPYVPPTIEELRAGSAPIPRIDFRNRALEIGITTTVINEYLASISDPLHQEEMRIFWEDSQWFQRLDTFCVELGEYAGKTPEEMDTIWRITA